MVRDDNTHLHRSCRHNLYEMGVGNLVNCDSIGVSCLVRELAGVAGLW